MVNHTWCKVCAAHKNDIVNQLKWNTKQSVQAFIQGKNVLTKHQVWIFSGFFCKGHCLINSTKNVDILKKHEIRFFLIKLKIFYIWALNFPHVYISMLC